MLSVCWKENDLGSFQLTFSQFKILSIDIFKFVNNLKPTPWKIFNIKKISARVGSNNITVRRHTSSSYGDKSLITLGQKFGINFQKTLNLRHHSINLRYILHCGQDQHVDATVANLNFEATISM